MVRFFLQAAMVSSQTDLVVSPLIPLNVAYRPLEKLGNKGSWRLCRRFVFFLLANVPGMAEDPRQVGKKRCRKKMGTGSFALRKPHKCLMDGRLHVSQM